MQRIMEIVRKSGSFVGNHVRQRLELHPDRPYKGYAWLQTVEGGDRQFLQLANQDYLGLSMEPTIHEGVMDCLQKYGYGRTANSFAGGHCDLHTQLENKISSYYNTETTLLHDSCARTNIATIPALTDEHSYIISDEYSHRSLIDGCKLSRVPHDHKYIFKHNNMQELTGILESLPLDANKLIIGDGLCSIMGGLMKLDEIVPLAKKYNAIVLVDEAHAIGVVGPHGKGTHDYYNIDLSLERIIITGSLAKTLQSAGGYLTGPRDLIDRVRLSSGTVFSGNPLPLDCFYALKTMDLLTLDRLHQLNHNVEQWIQKLRLLGLTVHHQVGPIVTIDIGDTEKAVHMMQSLYMSGVMAMGAIPPVSPPGKSIIRTMVTAGMTESDIEFATHAMSHALSSFIANN